jgi:ribosomal protein S12 methylthiotransferase accessory factor
MSGLSLALPGEGRVVELHDWDLAACAQLADQAWADENVLVPVRVDGALVLVGPVQFRGAAVCLECAEHSRSTAAMGRAADDRIVRRGMVPPSALEPLTDLVDHALALGRRAGERVWILDGQSLTVDVQRARSRHTGCPRCHPLPDDASARVLAPRRSGIVVDPALLREANPRSTRQAMRQAFTDTHFGPVRRVGRSDRICLPISYAEVADRRLDGDGGYGRATCSADADRVAMFEAVERITGMAPGRHRTALRASLRELGTQLALDPRRLGRHEPAAEDHPSFALAKFHDDLPITWVWGHSQQRSGPLAVPEQAAYWGVPAPLRQGVLAESSNGCGLGNSVEEAALFGLFELIERDAFLMAWWARTPLPRVPFPADDPFLAGLRSRLDSLGYDVLLLEATSDFRIPVVAAVALHRDPTDGAPQTFVAAGAHLGRASAIRSALVELVVNVEHAPNLAREGTGAFDRARLRPMLADPTLVRSIDDHVGLNSLPEARVRFEPLLSGPGATDCDADFGAPGTVASAPAAGLAALAHDGTPIDLAALLDELRVRALAVGVDTVIVDQTPPRLARELGLYAARVVAPGMLPLTFGHLYRRTLGVSRLLDVPKNLGRLAAAPDYAALPLDPHPFP